MKKIIIAFAAIAAAFSLVSCNKEQLEAPATDLKLNIKVANLDGSADTKAVKTGWADGDKINIWYDETNYTNPDLVIKYDGSEWKKDATASVSGKEPAASGNLIVLYEGYNDWSMYLHTSKYLYPKTDAYAGAMNGYAYAQPLAYSNNNTIAYTYESDILSADLDSWKSLIKIQVVVTGLDKTKASNYVLKEQNLSNGVAVLESDNVQISGSMVGGVVLGVANEDGIAFCFRSSYGNPSSRTFTLLDLTTFTEKTYTVSGKSLETATSKVTAIKIDYSKFAGAAETTGTAKRTGDIEVNWVQLWENGPKFAEYNVGAANNKAEDYGGYYCWGKSIDKDPYGSYNEGTDNLTGADDTATNLWGSAWRMPTQAELQALLDNCDVEWTTVNSVNGRKFTGKGDYASNSVFLPAAGYCFHGKVDDYFQGSYAYYWSSTPSSSYAYYLCSHSGSNYVSSMSRYYGQSVRAVLAE